RIQLFPLATKDISGQWTLPEGVLGREKEQESLRQAIQRVSQGAKEVMWISGGEGLGKTSLVMETLQQALPSESFFIVSQQENSSATSPYALWLRGVEKLVEHILTLSQLQVEVWRLRILDALQGYGQLLIEKAPFLEVLLGKQEA